MMPFNQRAKKLSLLQAISSYFAWSHSILLQGAAAAAAGCYCCLLHFIMGLPVEWHSFTLNSEEMLSYHSFLPPSLQQYLPEAIMIINFEQALSGSF